MFKLFKRKQEFLTDLEKCISMGLITPEEKLRLELERADTRLKDFLAKKTKKRKH